MNIKFQPFFILIFFLSHFQKSYTQIINIEDKRVRLSDSTTLKGFVDLGFNIFKNDKTLTTARAAGQLEKLVYQKHFFLLIGGYNFAKAEGQSFLNDGFLHLRYNLDLSSHFVYEAYTQVQYNERTNILFRGILGTGVRVKLKGGNNRFYFGLSYMYEQNQFNKNIAIRQENHRMSTYLSYNINLNHNSRFVHTSYFQPLINDFSNHRLSSDATLLFNITKRLIFKASFNTSYDIDPRLPESIPDLIYTWTNGLRWDF